jgi:hypothetical protein
MIKTLFVMIGAFLYSMHSEAQDQTIHFNPKGERNIKILLKNSNITVLGSDNTDVVISASKVGGSASDQANLDLKVENNDSSLNISKISEDKYTYVIKVPRKANLYFEEEMREPVKIVISHMEGKIHAKSWVSSIVLQNVTGPVEALSNAADISVVFSSFNPTAASTIVSLGRAVDITLPADTKANLNLEVESGKVTSDFDLGAENKEALYSAGSTRTIRSKINGGGAEIDIKANEITIHKAN